MGIRETLNKNPQAVTGATIGITVLALLLIVWQLWPSSGSSGTPTKAFFTIDDGQTYFEDDIYKIPPFNHKGKEAVRAHVYQMGEKGKPFVGWMEKFPPDIKTRIEKYYSDSKNRGTYLPEFYDDMCKMVKKKGMPQWVPGNPMLLQTWRMIEDKGQVAAEIYPEE